MKDKYPIPDWKWFLGMITYFILFSFVLPKFASLLASWENPSMPYLGVKYQFLIYFITFFPLLYCLWPLLKKERHINFEAILETILYAVLLMLLLNVVFEIILNFFQKPVISNNQASLDFIKFDNKFLYIMMLVLIGPCVEEFVFRGLIFRKLQIYFNFLVATLTSSLMFGFIHIMHSVFNGDFSQFNYLLTYSVLGSVFCFVYKKHDSIYAAILLHMLYNLLANIRFIIS